MGTGVKTGQKNEIQTIALKFLEVQHADYVWKDPTPVKQTKRDGKDIERWVYVFKVYRGKPRLTGEVQFDKDGKMKLVDWSDVSKWKDKDERDASVEMETYSIKLPANEDDWPELCIFLSEIQLPYKRLKYYVDPTNIDALRERSQLNTEPVMEVPIRLNLLLPNYMGLATKIHEEYKKNLEKLDRLTSSQQEAVRVGQAQLTLAVAEQYAENDDDVWDWVSKPALEKFLKDHEARYNYLNSRNEKLAKLKTALMSIPGFNAMQFDYTGEQFHEVIIGQSSKLWEEIHRSEAGRKYLKKVVGNQSIWYSKLVEGDKAYELGEKTFGATTGLAEQFLNIAGYWCLEAVDRLNRAGGFLKLYDRTLEVANREKYLDEIANLLGKRLDGLDDFAKLPNGKYFMVISPKDKTMPHTIRFAIKDTIRGGTAEYNKLHELSEQRVKQLKAATAHLSLILNAINLILAGEKLAKAAESGKAWDMLDESIGVVSSTGGLIGSAQFILEKRFGAQLFQRVAFVTAVVNYGGSLSKIARASWKGKELQVIGNVGAALGATATAVGLVATGAAAAWWTGIGIVLALGSAIFLYLISETPIEKVLKKGPWRKEDEVSWGFDKPRSDDQILSEFKSLSTKQLEKAVDELRYEIARFEPKVRYTDLQFESMLGWRGTKIEVTIQPAFVLKKARFDIVVKGWVITGQTGTVKHRDVVELHRRVVPVKFNENSRPEPITFVVDLYSDELRAKDRAGFQESVRIEARLDLRPDGSFPVPKSGKHAWWWFRFDQPDKAFKKGNSEFE